ncbi:DUF6056 family protein [Flavobacterium silvaticum]|uniref:Uncharacterized protein n=1 Tax=Flavobacterium silvaticum TaxID=1852020 RepID=A0A972JGV3_9FLAO|nr:DUF6056 family protein [Flavobacterium silvaticum]NMH28586.1 hypothetical protein [Flavobacterium silvaticum]
MIKLKTFKYLSLFIFAYTIFPFLVLCFFNVPLGDDFWYAEFFRKNGFWQTQSLFYHNWSGRYISSAAISGLNPASYGNFTLFFIHPLLLILGTAWALHRLVKNAVTIFKLGVDANLLFAFLFFFYCNYVPDFGETFYWMAGSFTYQLPIIFFLAYLNALLLLFHSDSVFRISKNTAIAVICLAICLGCNEVMTVYVNAVNCLVLFLLFSQKNYLNRFTPLFILAFVISFLMISAPGNFVRGALFAKSDFHFLKACGQALARSIFMIFFWLTSLTLILLCIPGEAKNETPVIDRLFFFVKTKKTFLLVSLVFLIGMLFVGFFPSIYATNWIPQRAYTPIFFVFTLIASLLIFALIQKVEILSKANTLLSDSKISLIVLPLLAVGLSQNSNVMNAYVDITSGKANSYHKQVLATYEMLRTTKNDTVIISPIEKKPLVLPYRWPGGNGLVDAQLAQYFKTKHLQYTGNE